MSKYSLDQRCNLYNKTFRKWPDSHLWIGKRFIRGIWMIGNDFRNKSNYYGAYPRGYLKRIMSMFPDMYHVLHIFSGGLKYRQLAKDFPDYQHYLLDINLPRTGKNIVKAKAEELSQYFQANSIDLCLADPPYDIDTAMKYGLTYMVDRRKVMREAFIVTKKDGFMVWMDMIKPMFRKDEWYFCGTIGIDRSTNHRVRFIYIFQRI